jgi:hypothetical protein
VSSNAFADLAHGVDLTAVSLRDLLNENKIPAPGSPADKEADGEPLAGEWGAHPARDIFATIMLASWSCADHLRGLAAVLQAQCSIAALYTLARGAAEASVLPCYLTEFGIDPLERVRRNMNCNLDGICQDLNMLRRFTEPDTWQKIARHEAQLAAIKRTGEHYGFAFTPPNRFRSAYLGDKPEPTITLIDKCTARTRGVGASSYQILCGVAHPRLHGLSRFLMTDTQATAAPGKVQTQLNIRAGELAQQLFVGPLCTTTLIEHLRWFLGWDTTEIDRSVTYMTNIWCRISGIPSTGPKLR